MNAVTVLATAKGSSVSHATTLAMATAPSAAITTHDTAAAQSGRRRRFAWAGRPNLRRSGPSSPRGDGGARSASTCIGAGYDGVGLG